MSRLLTISRNQIRYISTSPVAPLTEAAVNKRKFKFTYETAKNKITSESDLTKPENDFNFAQYKRTQVSKKITEEKAKLIPSVIALHSRLNLSPNFQYSTLVRSLTCKNKTSDLADNTQMSIFGSNLLSFYVTEYLITNYPRLPISILKTATDAYIGNFSLYDLSKNIWGIEEDNSTNLEKYLANEPLLLRYGKLRYSKSVTQPESGITKFSRPTDTIDLSKAEAFANSVRSIISGIYVHDGELATKKFIKNHILSRKIDISSMFQFKEPGKLLTKLLKSHNMELPTVRLMSETGRLSNSPVFVVGCFSGENLLSTGEGSSLKEARIRSFVKSLKAWYLYKPLDNVTPSEENFKGLFVDAGEKFY